MGQPEKTHKLVNRLSEPVSIAQPKIRSLLLFNVLCGLKRNLYDFWTGFLQGVTQPSLPSLMIMFCSNALAFVGLCFFITPDFVTGPLHHYLMMGPYDRFIPATVKLRDSSPAEQPEVVILGNSTTVSCIAGEKRLSNMIAQELGRPAPLVYDLSSGDQLPWEMEALVERLGPQFDGVLILGVNPGLFVKGNERLAEIITTPRYGFVSKSINEAARAAGLNVPSSTGIYLLDLKGFFLMRRYDIARNVFIRGPQPYGDPLKESYDTGMSWEKWWEVELEEFPKEVLEYESNKEGNFEVIRRIIARLKASGNGTFILFETPINPRWYAIPDGKAFHEGYRKQLKSFAEEQGVSLLSVTQEAALLSSDFYDYGGHLKRGEAVIRCTQAIASHAAKIIKKKEAAANLTQ